jgi:hypothetical protein
MILAGFISFNVKAMDTSYSAVLCQQRGSLGRKTFIFDVAGGDCLLQIRGAKRRSKSAVESVAQCHVSRQKRTPKALRRPSIFTGVLRQGGGLMGS